MTKIYCGDCKHQAESSGMYSTWICLANGVTTDTYHSRYTQYEDCEDLNDNNDCEKYEPNISKRFRDWIRGVKNGKNIL